MELQIPINSPTVQIAGVLVTADVTKNGAQCVQVLFTEHNMGIPTYKHLLNLWGPENFEECQKFIGKTVTVAALKSGQDNQLYRLPKGTRLVPSKA